VSSSKPEKSVKSAKLVWQDAGGNIREYFLNENTSTFIGRDVSNDIVFAEPEISSQHATIYWKDDTFEIVDQDSSNGTFINSRRITNPRSLQDEDRIEIGDHILSYYYLGERLIEEFKTMRLTESPFQSAAEAAFQPTQIQEPVQPPSPPSAPAVAEPSAEAAKGESDSSPDTQDLIEDLETIVYEDVDKLDAISKAPPEAAPEAVPEESVVAETVEEAIEEAEEEMPEPAPGDLAELEIDFSALISQLKAAQSEAQKLDKKGRATSAKLESFIERQNASIQELDAIVREMGDLNAQAAESGIVTLLEKLSADPRNILLLAEMAAYPDQLANLIKDYTAQSQALGKTRDKMKKDVADFIK
jgi:pSer/pThr/pTyr-binding forkhead associated (FHA) protein